MAEKVKITDFIRWALKRIDPAELSAAMTDYGYNDDSIESIIDAMERFPVFIERFGVLLGEGQRAYLLELERTNQSDDDLTFDDWNSVSKARKASFATGLEGGSDTEKKPNWWDVNGSGLITSVLGIAGGILTGVFGGTQQPQQQQTQQQQGSSMTFVWIILGVVVLAGVGIVIMATMKKK